VIQFLQKSFNKFSKPEFFLESTLHSYSQILFSDSKIVGLIVLTASFFNPEAGINGLLGCLLVNHFAYHLGFDQSELKAGLYGLNGVLLGIAVNLYSDFPLLRSLFIIVLFSLLLVLVISASSKYLKVRFLPSMSLPFVLVSWMMILSESSVFRKEVLNIDYITLENIPNIFFKNVGHILFSPTENVGIAIMIALLYYSPILAFITVVSFALCTTFALIFPEYITFLINNGFNVILSAVALGGVFYVPNLWSLSIALIASLLTLLVGQVLQTFFTPYHVPVLAAPFNFTALLMLFALKKESTGGLYPVTLFKSPEENFTNFLKEKANVSKGDYGFNFPFIGEWFVSQGSNGKHTHKGIHQWAFDFVVRDKKGSFYRGGGQKLEEHYCYKMPVISPGEGVVVSMESSIKDNAVSSTNLAFNWGNNIIIKHSPYLFSEISHFTQGGVQVTFNQIVKKGQNLGAVGSSGCAPYPHLHIQFQAVGMLGNPTIPIHFSDYLIKDDRSETFVSVGLPEEGQTVLNLPVDLMTKAALGFELDQKMKFDFFVNGKKKEEVWQIDMDSLGILYIESSLHKEKLFFFKGDRSMTLLRYEGKKKSGLYLFSLGLEKIPFYASDHLHWQTRLPYGDILQGVRSRFWESVQPYLPSKSLTGKHAFKKLDQKWILRSLLYSHQTHIADRTIVFEDGLTEITARTKGNNFHLRRS